MCLPKGWEDAPHIFSGRCPGSLLRDCEVYGLQNFQGAESHFPEQQADCEGKGKKKEIGIHWGPTICYALFS